MNPVQLPAIAVGKLAVLICPNHNNRSMEPYTHHSVLMKLVRQLDDSTVIVENSTLCCHREQPRIILAIAGLQSGAWLAVNNHPSVSMSDSHLRFVLQFGGSGQRFEVDLTSDLEVRQGRYCYPAELIPSLAIILGGWVATARNTYALLKSPHREHEDWATLDIEAGLD